jgi:hypothetical protein
MRCVLVVKRRAAVGTRGNCSNVISAQFACART